MSGLSEKQRDAMQGVIDELQAILMAEEEKDEMPPRVGVVYYSSGNSVLHTDMGAYDFITKQEVTPIVRCAIYEIIK